MIDERVSLMQELIENPSAEKAVKMLRTEDILLCVELGDGNRLCRNCVWRPACHIDRVRLDKITDEMLSVMVLEAIQVLVMHEVEDA